MLLLLACTEDPSLLGQGDGVDARFSATALAWKCMEAEGEDSTMTTSLYEGIWAFDLELAYAPDATEDRGLPTDLACQDGLDLFPGGAGDGGNDIPDVDDPAWDNGSLAGELAHTSTGYYLDVVIEDQQACSLPDTLFGDGPMLSDAGAFSGAALPDSGTVDLVEVSGEDEDNEISFGADIEVAFDPSGWDRSFVHVRREGEGGTLLESQTCDLTGLTSLSVGADFWDAFNEVLKADATMLYVGFVNDDEYSTKDGQRIAVESRLLHTVVVN